MHYKQDTAETEFFREIRVDFDELLKSSGLTSKPDDLRFDFSFLEKFLTDSSNFLYVHDLRSGKYFFTTNLLEKLLKYPPGSLNPLDKSLLLELIHPDDKQKFMGFQEQLLNVTDGKFMQSEFRLQSGDGRWLSFLVRERVYDRDHLNRTRIVLGMVTDVTGLKQYEPNSQSAVNIETRVIENATEYIWSIDRHFRLIFMNQSSRVFFNTVSGKKPNAGMSILEFLPESQTKEIMISLNRAFSGENVRFDLVFQSPDLDNISEINIDPVKNSAGQITLLNCFGRDVSRQRESEKTHLHKINLLTSVFDNDLNSNFIIDTGFCYVAFNKKHKETMKRIYGVDIQIGMNARDIVLNTQDYSKSVLNFNRALGGESFSVITEYGLDKLERQIYELFYSPIKDGNGSVTGVSLLSMNITEKIKSQQKLLDAESKITSIFEHSPDAIFLEDIDGNILDLNASAVSMQGLPKEKLKGKNIRDLVPAERADEIVYDYKKLFTGEIKYVNSSVWNANGKEIPVEITGKNIRVGTESALLVHVRDITEQKKIAEERRQILLEKARQKEELIRASMEMQVEERNRISTEMHDELGSTLSKISILCQVIKRSSELPESVSVNVDKIIQSSKHLQESISEIIWSMDPKNDTAENLVSYINYFTSEFLETGPVKFKINLPTKIPTITLAGKLRRNIFLVVKETLNNVVKHSGANWVHIDVGFVSDTLTIIIRDDGKGFDPKNVQRFKNGIINMKRRISQIGGSFHIDSEINKGTSTQILIPVDDSKNLFLFNGLL